MPRCQHLALAVLQIVRSASIMVPGQNVTVGFRNSSKQQTVQPKLHQLPLMLEPQFQQLPSARRWGLANQVVSGLGKDHELRRKSVRWRGQHVKTKLRWLGQHGQPLDEERQTKALLPP